MESSSYPQCANARRADARIRAYTGEGMFTDDPLDRFGTKAGVRITQLQSLMQRNLPQWT